MTATLTPAMRSVLSGPRIVYRNKRDSTMAALHKRGFAEFTSNIGAKYARPSWYITDAGRAALSARTRTATGKSGAEDHSIQKDRS